MLKSNWEVKSYVYTEEQVIWGDNAKIIKGGRETEREGEGERTTRVKERKKESVSWGDRIQSGF